MVEGGAKNEMASVLVTVESEQEPDLLPFSFFFPFHFNQKQRRPAVEKHDEKQSLHELKAERGRRQQGETGRDKQTDNY